MFPLQRRDEVNLARQGLYPGFLRSILRQKEATPPFALLLQDDLTGEIKYHDADFIGGTGRDAYAMPYHSLRSIALIVCNGSCQKQEEGLLPPLLVQRDLDRSCGNLALTPAISRQCSLVIPSSWVTHRPAQNLFLDTDPLDPVASHGARLEEIDLQQPLQTCGRELRAAVRQLEPPQL
jgi:hypothetical protein